MNRSSGDFDGFAEEHERTRTLADLLYVIRERWLVAAITFAVVSAGVVVLILSNESRFSTHAVMHVAEEGVQQDELAMLANVEGRTAVDAEMAVMASLPVARRAAEEHPQLHAWLFEVNSNRAWELVSRAYGLARSRCRLDIECVAPVVPVRGRMYRLRTSEDGRNVRVVRKHSEELVADVTMAVATSEAGFLVEEQRIRLTLVSGAPGGREFLLHLRDVAATAAYLHGGVRVKKAGKWTGLINLGFEGADPEMAARAANALADSYIEHRRDRRQDRLQKREEWLKAKIKELRGQLEGALTDRDNFVEEQGAMLLQEKAQAAATNIAELTTQRFEHEQHLFVEQAALSELKAGGDPLFFLSAEGAGSDPQVQALADRLSVLRISRRTLVEGKDLTEESSRVKELDAEIEAGESLLKERNEYLRARVEALIGRRIDAIEQRLGRIDGEIARNNGVIDKLPGQQRQLATLQRKVTVYATSLEFLERKLEETGIAIKSVPVNAETIEAAVVPSSPARSLLVRALLAGIVLGLLAGVLAAFLRNARDHAIHDPRALEEATGLRLYAAIPDYGSVRRRDRRGLKGPLVARDLPRSVLAESYRTLRANLRFSESGDDLRALSITSALPSEGKTVTTLNLATVIAQAGDSVIVVDADLRRSMVHVHLEGDRGPGVGDVLTGAATLDEAVRSTGVDGFSYLAAGSASEDPAALLESASFRDLLATLRERYDYVLFDVPPVLGVADAASFFSALDGILLVGRAGKAPGAVIDGAREQVERLGGNLLGVILNGFDVARATSKRHVGSGYYGYYGYYGQYGYTDEGGGTKA